MTTPRQGVDRPAAQDVEVDGRDLPALDVPDPRDPEQLALDRPQPGVLHPVAEHAPHERQQVEVAGVGGRGAAGQPVPGLDQRPVEPAPVVGHQPRVGRDPARRSRRAAPARRRDRGAAAGSGRTRRPPSGRARRGTRGCRPPSRGPSSPCRGTRAGRRPADVRAASARRSRSSGSSMGATVRRTSQPPSISADVRAERRGEAGRQGRAPAARERRTRRRLVRPGRPGRRAARASPAGSRGVARA